MLGVRFVIYDFYYFEVCSLYAYLLVSFYHKMVLYYVLGHFSHVWICVIPWNVAFQVPLSMRFSRQEYWSELPFPPPNPGTEHASLTSPPLVSVFFPLALPGKPGVEFFRKLFLHRFKWSYVFTLQFDDVMYHTNWWCWKKCLHPWDKSLLILVCDLFLLLFFIYFY